MHPERTPPPVLECLCGYHWRAQIPAVCPECGVTLTVEAIPYDAWLDRMRDEIGQTTSHGQW